MINVVSFAALKESDFAPWIHSYRDLLDRLKVHGI